MTFTLNKKLPNMVYYNDDHSKTPDCTGEVAKAFGATYSLPSTWQELTNEIEKGEINIVFHIDMITKSGETINNFITSIRTVGKFTAKNTPLRILVLITPHTTQEKIKELQNTKIIGIGLDLNYYPIEEVVEGVKALCHGIDYWPEHIISRLPVEEKKPISVYFRKGWREYFQQFGNNEPQLRSKLEKNPDLPWETKMCGDWDELSDTLKLNPHQIIFHVSMVTNSSITVVEFVNMIKTLKKVTVGNSIPIAIAIESDTPLSMIKDFQKAGIYGLVPSASTFGINETHKGIEALFNRIPYWPKHILDQLPGNKKKITTSDNVDLTPRQTDVLKLIKERGASNKAIARTLGISESTVKLHITEIFKKYGVRNRTQLAVFSHS